MTIEETGVKPRAVLWAHNSHLGDARATEMSQIRELNLGQLVRSKFGLDRSFNIGFTTYDGTVLAARRWGGTPEVMSVIPGLPGSYEDLHHQISKGKGQTQDKNAQKGEEDQKKSQTDKSEEGDISDGFFIGLRTNNEKKYLASSEALKLLSKPRLERFIGVQYVKATERRSHYSECCLPRQFDCVFHIDRTAALKALDPVKYEDDNMNARKYSS